MTKRTHISLLKKFKNALFSIILKLICKTYEKICAAKTCFKRQFLKLENALMLKCINKLIETKITHMQGFLKTLSFFHDKICTYQNRGALVKTKKGTE
ncbi:MAG: hypothetical protein LBP54_00890 [Campylobacteraceae bacterium]|nr:hypothetical protein [Campylobacteraceae bacterium]